MKRLFATALLAAGACAVGALANQPGPMPTPSARLGIEMDVQPVQGQPGKFMVSSTITDLENNAVVAKPRLMIGDTPAKIQTGSEGKWALQISVGANSKAGSSQYEATFTREGQVVSRQRFSVNLGTQA